MYIAELDASKIHLAPLTTGEKQQKQVLVYRDASMSARNRIEVQLCPDETAPLECKYRLDTVQDGQDPLRRGQKVKVYDETTLAALARIDEKIVATAIERSLEWFGKSLSAEQVRARYKFIAQVDKVGEDFHTMKFAVKAPGSKVPTQMHLLEASGDMHKHGGRTEHLELSGARVVPIVSAYSIWFLAGGKQFGLSFQAEKMLITPGQARDDLAGFTMSKRVRVIDEENDAAVSGVELVKGAAVVPDVELLQDEDAAM